MFLFRIYYLTFLLTILGALLFPSANMAQTIDFDSIDTCQVYTDLENALRNPEKVYVLKLSRNKLTTFPKEILQFKNLNVLDLSKNKLKSIPEEIGTLTHLQKLNLGKNRLESFPLGITDLLNLKKLILNQNYITGIPFAIRNLQKLDYLDMWSNDLSEISDGISELKNLKELDLRVIQFSDKEQERITKLLPETLIHFSNSCNCGD